MKPTIENEKSSDSGDRNKVLGRAFKWMKIRKGVYRFHSHEEADDWWKDHLLLAYRRASEAQSGDLFFLRQLLESQGITPPE